jgi:hypothetical protein
MRRRFGRSRRDENGNGAVAAPIDAAAWLRRLAESELLGVPTLEPFVLEGVAASFAALGSGVRPAGERVVAAVAPRNGIHAILAALAAARSEESANGSRPLFAVAASWSDAARSLLRVVAPDAALRALALPETGETGRAVEPAAAVPWSAGAPADLAEWIDDPEDRDLFLRAVAALEGLAAKHAGAIRCAGREVEFVLMARRVALLRAAAGRIELETRLPDRITQRLGAAELATALDRLEGTLRKRINDRKVRSAEDGLRAAVLPRLERAIGARFSARWPLAGSEPEIIDLMAVSPDGTPRFAWVRERVGLPELAAGLELSLRAQPTLVARAARAGIATRDVPFALSIAAAKFDAAALTALSQLGFAQQLYDVQVTRSGEHTLAPRAALAPAPLVRRETPREAARIEPRRVQVQRGERQHAEPEPVPQQRTEPHAAIGASAARPSGRFEEVSLFDLEEEARGSGEPEESAGGRRRRGRGRRRGRRSGRGGERDAEQADGGETGDARSAPLRNPRGGGAPSGRGRSELRLTDAKDTVLDADDDDETLAPLDADAPELEEAEEPRYEDEEEVEDVDREQEERELRRRARIAKAAPAIEPEAPKRQPRRRAAFVAHADRVSVLSTIVLARDVRLVEGFWVYPQDDLMTFFRSVATDLRDETPIFLVGFTASPPARDTLQAAALYRGRLSWFDHHEWPPEDLQALRIAIGEENVHILSGADSSLSAILADRSRRSRFSDKLVELITGRFSQHDYERWGRVWWQRVDEIASQHGERRADVEPLLVGRPSDLARDAAGLPLPPLPPELAYVSGRDFRLVHFGGFRMVVTPVPAELDLHLTSRIARERHEAQLSLAYREDHDLLVLGGDESRSRRGLDLGGMVDHLAAKYDWIAALPDEDQVARMRVERLWSEPGRLDEIVSEIAMGRSIVEA